MGTGSAPLGAAASFAWALLRDLVTGLLTSLALAIGWFAGLALGGPENWLARVLALVTFLLLGLLSILTLRELLLRAADTAVAAARIEPSRLLAELTSLSLGVGCLTGAWLPLLAGRPWSDVLGGIAVVVGAPLIVIGGAAAWVRWRIARRAARAPGGFDPREIETAHAMWPLLVIAFLLACSVAAGVAFGPAEPPIPTGARGEMPGFTELTDGAVGELGAATPYVDEVRSRAQCFRLHLRGSGDYRVVVSAERFAPVAILANDFRATQPILRESAHGAMREVAIRFTWQSQRLPFLIVGSEERSGAGPYRVRVERLGQ